MICTSQADKSQENTSRNHTANGRARHFHGAAIPPRPHSCHVSPERAANIPQLLRDKPRWVIWRWTWREDEQKWDKPPINPKTGLPTNATDAAAWMTFEEARAAALRLGDGIGLALGEDGPFAGVDLDGVVAADGTIDPRAGEVINRLDSYTEFTPSGRGVRVWVFGHLPRGGNGKARCRTKNEPWIEFYDHGRYFTVTGDRLDGPSILIEERSAALAELHAEILPATEKAPRTAPERPATALDPFGRRVAGESPCGR